MNPVDWLSGTLMLIGCAALLIGALGLIRLPDLFTRMHAASVIDTLAALAICGGLILQAGFSLVSLKLAMILFFLIFTTPVAAHALAKSALNGAVKPLQGESGNPK